MAELSSFGEWLRRRRKAEGLTQEQLAQQISCSTSALRKIEAEERRPSEQIVAQLADVFNIPSDERPKFLKFARGKLEVAPVGEFEVTPWRISTFSKLEARPKTKIHLATFLFTDIERSTQLWENAPERMKVALQRHHAILQNAILSNGGQVFQIVDDAYCAVFPTAPSVISAAVIAQREIYQELWDLPFPIRVRMGIHTGEAEPTDAGGYASNPTMNRVARILQAGHGGQVLLSLSTKALVADSLPVDTELGDMGEHRLKNLVGPEHLFQLNITGLPRQFPPLNTISAPRHNLPAQLTSFIGHETDITDVMQLLKNARLITLTGAGGTGKTRLSLQIANDVLDQYADGVWMVEFAPLFDPLLVPRITAMAIGLRDEPHRPVIDLLCDYLREKQMLILLDNCEHLVDACAQLADTLLHACPQLHLLATSREVLGVAGEKSYLVPSLALPNIQNLPPSKSMSHYEAIQLFIDRATSAVPTFVVTEENVASIAQICQRLDGIPLAIELAASKIRALSAHQIAQRLDDGFRLLVGGSRTALPRHQTLQATIEWSYNLLNPREQVLFRRLSVFVGGWTLEAAESICSDRDTKGALKSEDILQLLTQLVNKSLVIAEERKSEVRYRMLETIRQYADEDLLKSGEANKVQTHHLDFFMKLSEDAEPKLLGRDQLIWLDRLEDELDNIRRALEWSAKDGNTVGGLRLAGALWRFWSIRNRWGEGRKWLAALISHLGTEAPTRARAKALYAAGILAQNQNDHASAGPIFSEGLAISRELRDKPAIGYFLIGLANTWERYRGERDALQLLDESLEIFEKLGDKWGIALSLGGQGAAALVLDDFATARSLLIKSIALYRELGDKISLSLTLNGLANVMMFEGNYERAARLYEESLALFREMGHKRGISHSLRFLGEVARCQNNYEQARMLYEESLVVSREIGDRSSISGLYHNLAYVSQHQHDYHQAVILFTKSLKIYQELKDTWGIALCLIGLGGQVQATGYPERAAHLFGAAQPLFDASSHRLEPADQIEYQRNLNATRAQLAEATFASAFTGGQKLSLDEVLDLVLKTVEEM